MSKNLPARPNLRNLRNQAKRLLKAHLAGHRSAAQRLQAHLDRFAWSTEAQILAAGFSLQEAQQVIAHEYDFADWAALKYHVDALQVADGDGDNSKDVESILRAVETGDAEKVETMLRAKSGLATERLERHSGEMACMTLLHRTDPLATDRGREMTEGHLRVAQLLIDHGANVNAIVDSYSPPLDVAAWTGNVQLAELLLANGADPNLGTEAKPVDTALSHGHREIFDLLVQYGAQYHIEHTIQVGLLKETRALIDEDPDRVNEPLPGGHMPLTLAAGRPAIFNLLLRRGADIHRRDPLGYTPLLAARSAGNDKAIQILLERGASEDIFSAIAQRDVAKVAAILEADPTQAHPVGDGPAPILWAVSSDWPPIVELLLEQKVEVDICRSAPQASGSTPLTRAICNHSDNSDEVVRLLLEYGADPDSKDIRNWPGCNEPDHPSPLSARTLTEALRWGTNRSVGLLLDAGADVNGGLTWAAGEYGGGLDRVKLLLERGADMGLPHHEAVFIDAAYRGKLALVELLATHGVDLAATRSVVKNKPRTALYWAQRRGNTQMAALLEELAAIARRPSRQATRTMRTRRFFIHAVIDGDADALRPLLAAEPALAQRPLAWGPLFSVAAREGRREVADVLAEYGAPWTIDTAAALGRIDQIEALLDADPLLIHEAEPLYAAARADQVAAVELLLDRGADIDRRVGRGAYTALHIAVERKAVNAIEVLLARGANVHIKTRWKNTPLARNNPPTIDREPIRDLLLAYGARLGSNRPVAH
ncbi:MAG: hypothetical protein GKR89_33980 [Candidatus Latescibacteria bacterium]|nr:hypothetical protein [Candidatus Latescibacterota bacterium]